MKSYNGVSGERRAEIAKEIREALKDGRLQKPTHCAWCGQTKGRIDFHSETYKDIYDHVHLCLLCHLMHHSRSHCKLQYAWYREQIAQGKRYRIFNVQKLFDVLHQNDLKLFQEF